MNFKINAQELPAAQFIDQGTITKRDLATQVMPTTQYISEYKTTKKDLVS